MNREIPVQQKQEHLQSFRPVEVNIENELNQIMAHSMARAEHSIKLKLENDDFQFRKLATDTINTVYEENKTNPQALEAELRKTNNELISSVPIANRGRANEYLWQNSQGYIAKAKSNELRMLNDQARANSISDIAHAAREVNEFAGNFFSADQDLQIEAAGGINTAYGRMLQAIQKQGSDGLPLYSAEDQIKTLQAFNKNLVISGLHAQYDNLETQEAKRAYLQQFSDKNIEVSLQTLTGDMEPSNVANMLTRGEFESVRNYMERGLKEIDDKLTQNQLSTLFDLTDQGIQVAPLGNAAYTKFVNDKYQNELIPSMIGVSPNEQVQKMSAFVEKHGAPASLVNQVKAWSSLGDDRQYSTAVSFLKKLIDINSPQLSKFDGDELASARFVAENLNTDVSLERIRRIANEKFGPQTKEGYKLREDEFNSMVKNVDLSQLMADFLDVKPEKALSGVAQINSNAMVNLRSELKAQMLLTGNLKDSIENAKIYFKANYGLSKVNGNTLMKHPPEEQYNIRELTKKFTNIFTRGKYDNWAKDQFKEFLLGIGINNEIQMEGSFIDSDEITEREKAEGKPLSYRVYTLDPSGGYNIVQYRFVPDPQKTIAEINTYLNEYPTLEAKKAKIDKTRGPLKNMATILQGYEQLY